MGQRWERAKADSHGWVFKREVAIAAVCGVLAVGAIALTGGPDVKLGNEAIVFASALLGVLLLPPLELAWNYLKAPKRLLRARVEELEQIVPSATDPATLVQEFSTWLQAKRAGRPERPTTSFGNLSLLFNKEAKAKAEAEDAVAMSKYRQTDDEVERQARVEYHEQFRASVLAIVGDGHERARNPQSFQDFEAVEAMLLAAKPVSPEDVAEFKDFTQRFAGWFKSQKITAPPDMTEALGAGFEDEQVRKVADGKLSFNEYQRNVESFTERREWAKELRGEYQRDWRAEVARQVEWARESGAMEREDYLALILVENPQSDDLTELVASVERMAGRL